MTFADESATWTSAGALGLAALFLALGIFLFWRWRRAAAREIAARAGIDCADRAPGRRDPHGARRRAGGRPPRRSSRRAREHARPRCSPAEGPRSRQRAQRRRRGADRPPPGGGRADHRRLRALRRRVLARAHRPAAGWRQGAGGPPQLPLHGRGGGERRVPPERRPGRSAPRRERGAHRHAGHLLAPRRADALRLRARAVRGALAGLRAGARECAALLRGTPARGHRSPHGPPQRALLRGTPAAGDRAGAALRPATRAPRLRPGAGGGADLVAAGERIRTAVRATDIASHLGEGRFAIILPEAAEADAERLHRRVQFALGGRVDSGADGVRIHAGLVELRAEDDANVFRERAEAALERAKQAAADRLSAAQ